jgi:hypothetical protein
MYKLGQSRAVNPINRYTGPMLPIVSGIVRGFMHERITKQKGKQRNIIQLTIT